MWESELIVKTKTQPQAPTEGMREWTVLLQWPGTCTQVIFSSNLTFSVKHSIYFYTFLGFSSSHFINSLPNNSLSLASNRADILIIDMPVLMKNFPYLDSSRTYWLQGVQSTAENHTFLKMYFFFFWWLMIILLNITVAGSLSNESILLSSRVCSTARRWCHHHWHTGCLRCQEADSNLYSNNLELIVKRSVNPLQEIDPSLHMS